MFERVGLTIVLSGPSGVGKGRICAELLKRNEHMKESVSATTRQPRPGETHGVDYLFVSDEEFNNLIKRDQLLEHALIFDHHYGTPKEFVEQYVQEGYDVLLEIDVQGAMNVMESINNAVYIFLLPPSMDELKRRISDRGTEGETAIALRFEAARNEMEKVNEYDYVVVNGSVEEAVTAIESIIAAEKQRLNRNIGIVKYLLNGGQI